MDPRLIDLHQWDLQRVCEEFNTYLSAAASPSIKLQWRNSQTFTTIYQTVTQEKGKKKQRARERDEAQL